MVCTNRKLFLQDIITPKTLNDNIVYVHSIQALIYPYKHVDYGESYHIYSDFTSRTVITKVCDVYN